jgi:hypothetical protein
MYVYVCLVFWNWVGGSVFRPNKSLLVLPTSLRKIWKVSSPSLSSKLVVICDVYYSLMLIKHCGLLEYRWEESVFQLHARVWSARKRPPEG